MLGLLEVLVLAHGAAAQQTSIPALQRRSDSLLALWREASRFAQVQQESHAAKVTSSTTTTRATAAERGMRPVQVGGLMILSDAPDAIPLRGATERAWSILDRTYGGAATALTARPLRLHVIRRQRPSARMAESREVFDDISAEVLTRTLLAMVGEPRPDSALRVWLNGGVRPLIDTAATRTAAYVQLVMSPSRASRSCLAGDLAGCRAALQLTDDTAFFLTVYDAADRRAAVAGARSPSILTPLERPIFNRCTVDRIDSACIDLLRGMGPGQVPRPLSDEARAFFISTVLGLGGAAAYDRLMANSTAALSDRIAGAGGMPLDSAVARWRAQLIAARPPAPNVPLRDGLLALGWMGILATCAARSTRWRVA